MKPIFKIFLCRFGWKFSDFAEGKTPKRRLCWNLSDFAKGKTQKNPNRTGIRAQRGCSYNFLLSLILLFSGGSAFAAQKYKNKDQNPAIAETNKHRLTAQQQKNQSATEKTNKGILTAQQQKDQNPSVEEKKNEEESKTRKASVPAAGLSKAEIERRRSLKKEGKRASYAFRPLLIQGKKRLIQKTKDMKVDSGNIAESELFFIDIDFKKRIFEHEGQR